jgi:hypothetical protein
VLGGERSIAGAGSSASTVVVTILAVLGPDALGGTGPVERPLLGLDLLDGSTVGQCSALLAILMSVWALANLDATGQRASVAAAAVSATLAQPLLNLLDEPVAAASVHLHPAAGWLSGAAVALMCSGLSVSLLTATAAVQSAIGRLARKIVRAVHLLVAFFARAEPTWPSRRCPLPVLLVVVGRTWVRQISRRGPPLAVVPARA